MSLVAVNVLFSALDETPATLVAADCPRPWATTYPACQRFVVTRGARISHPFWCRTTSTTFSPASRSKFAAVAQVSKWHLFPFDGTAAIATGIGWYNGPRTECCRGLHRQPGPTRRQPNRCGADDRARVLPQATSASERDCTSRVSRSVLGSAQRVGAGPTRRSRCWRHGISCAGRRRRAA